MHEMKPKSLLPTLLLLIELLRLSSTAYGCVNLFAAQGQKNWVDQTTWLDAHLWDNGGGAFAEVCTLSGYPNGNTQYVFKCNDGYTALLDPTDNSVQYTTPHGPYSFVTDYYACPDPADGCDMYKSCQYGCAEGNPDCFVYNCGLNYDTCAPP
jgi:hypothetical protein